MSQIGFGVKWRSWIQVCLNSAYASVLVNGSPTKEFKIERGLRQGDSLSHFLFILAVEALNVAFLEARNKNIFIVSKLAKIKSPFLIYNLRMMHSLLGNGRSSMQKICREFLHVFILHPGLRLTSTKVSSLELEYTLMSSIRWLTPLGVNHLNSLVLT